MLTIVRVSLDAWMDSSIWWRTSATFTGPVWGVVAQPTRVVNRTAAMKRMLPGCAAIENGRQDLPPLSTKITPSSSVARVAGCRWDVAGIDCPAARTASCYRHVRDQNSPDLGVRCAVGRRRDPRRLHGVLVGRLRRGHERV